ncbi:MAG: single-stranded DNA-binding protein [[Clostridium] leptum]
MEMENGKLIFFDVTAWRSTAEFVTRYFSKGSLITVDGRLESRKYTDKDGNNRVAIEIKADNVYFGESKENKETSQTSASPVSNSEDFVPDFSTAEVTGDDDLPFDEFPPFPG